MACHLDVDAVRLLCPEPTQQVTGGIVEPRGPARLAQQLARRQHAAAVDVDLTPAELARIEAELPRPSGARYDEAGMATVNR